MGSREADVSTNLHRELSGNSLHYGEDLTITVSDNPKYVAGRLMKLKSFGRKQVIQIEQTGHKNNPSKDSITFEMKNADGSNMERGKYRYQIKYDNGFSDQGIGDNFEIV
jgi:hypothetical protein